MGKVQESPLTETAFLILLAMYQPNHGYGVMQFVMEKTNGRVVFGPGTLYGAINNLSKKGWIKALPVEKNERKKDYLITDLGKLQVEAEMKRLKEVCEIGEEILRNKGVEIDEKV